MRDHRRSDVVVFALLSVTITIASALNSTLIFDDLFFAEYFRDLQTHGLAETFKTLFFILDLGQREYRLYGLSKFIHFALFWFFDTRAWAWGAFIGASQVISGWALYRLLKRLGVDHVQILAMIAVWILSPFAVTSCFHHYTYLIFPYQMTIACALILQRLHDPVRRTWLWRSIAIALGLVIALTGELHLISSPLILALVAWTTPSQRTTRARVIDAALPIAAMVIAAIAHRTVWSILVAPYNGPLRYEFALPTFNQAMERSATFLRSLPLGMTEQMKDIITFTGPSDLAVAAFAAGAAGGGLLIWRFASRKAPATGKFFALPLALFTVLISSFAVVFLLSVFSGQVFVIYPRRYGYIPYTLAAMMCIAVLWAEQIRQSAGRVPAAVFCAALAGLWFTLVTIDLPTVRAQDRRVYTKLSSAIMEKPGANVLVFTAWRETVQPNQPLSYESPGLRSIDFPVIFESPLSKYWWEGHYIMVMLGGAFVGDRLIEKDGSTTLLGNNIHRPSSIVVAKNTLVILADLNREPPPWTADPSTRAVVFTELDQFDALMKAFPGYR